MNILVVDSQGVLGEREMSYARNRLYYSLLRFEHRINRATMHFSFDVSRKQFKCVINVKLEGSGDAFVARMGRSSEEVMNVAVDAVEPKVACRVDWRAWFNADTMATCFVSMDQRMKWLFGFDSMPLQAKSGRRLVKARLGDATRGKTSLSGPHFSLGAPPSKTVSN